MNDLIQVENLGKVFPGHGGEDVHAVGGVTFDCRAGEVFGLLGLNGAGKTTTLRMLSTVLQPTSGTARVAGHDIRTDAQEVRRAIGFLSGSTGLYHRLTAEEMLRFFGEFHGLSGAELDERVESAIAAFGIDAYRNKRCEKLSTGMKQKVNIARAIVHDPPVLILDEPTAGLDVLAAQATLEFVEARRDRGQCILFSTHIMSEVERLCDRIAIIHEGTLRALGTLSELRDATGEHYLEDVFRCVVTRAAA